MNRIFFASIILTICLFGGLYFYYHDKGVIAKVEYSMSSCFGGEESNLVLYEKDGVTIAELTTRGKPKQKVKLNKLQIDSFHLFVQNLKSLKEGRGCTTISDYILEMGNKTIKKTNGRCDGWNGFDDLIAFLFKKTKLVNNT